LRDIKKKMEDFCLMKYGYFDEKNREYVIKRPDTPAPWINYLGSDEYCALFSNTAGGYSFHKDPRDRRILRYRYNNLPIDRPGRYIYIKDKNKKDYWSASWQPVLKPLNKFKYECRHGIGYSVIASKYNGIASKVTYFVPLGVNAEVWMMELENTTSKARNLQLFSYLEFCMWHGLLDMTDFQYMLNIAKAYKKDNIILHETGHYPKYDKKNISFFSSSAKIKSYDCLREEFIGQYRKEDNPIAVEKGKCSNSVASGGNPCAGACFETKIGPKGKKTIVFVLGFGESESICRSIAKKYTKASAAKKALKELKNYWEEYFSTYKAKTPDKEVDLMVNTWNQYQCRTTFNWSRSASYYESGIGRGMGFRDSNQDTLGVMHSISEKVKPRICDLAACQFKAGNCYHQYFPLTKEGDGGGYSDDPLWLVLSVSAYLKETGDLKFLKHKVKYADKGKGTIFEHLCKAVDYVYKTTGPHKLPLAGFADWNDCLNLGGPKKHGESLMVAEQLVWAAAELVRISQVLKDKKSENKYKKIKDEMSKRINKVAWDGTWYLRGFNDDGKAIGTKKDKVAKIFLNTQSWAVLSGAADKKRAKKCMDNVKKYLNTKHGIILLNPAYRTFDPKIGAMGTFPGGLKENAGIFSHANPWAVIAESLIGRGDRSMEYYKKISPATRNKIAAIHKTEPYIYAQFISGKDHPRFGEAKNSWLTGSAAWNLVAVTQYILGIRPDYQGLVIDPCIPKNWKKFEVERLFRGNKYKIEVLNPKGVYKGIKEITVDNKKIEGNVLPLFKDKKVHKVKVVMG
jgi:cellobiose phosphorylase